jgi:cytochrome c-type biogenesis protein CcmI
VIYVIALLIIVAAAAAVAYPLFRRKEGPRATEIEEGSEDLRLRREKLYEAIRELELEREAGSVSPEEYEKIRGTYEMQAATLLQEEERRVTSPPQPSRASRPAKASGLHSAPAFHRLGLLLPAAMILLVGVGIGFFLGTSLTPRQEGMGITGSMVGSGSGGGAPSTLQEANAAFERGDFAQALEGYKRILDREPSNVEALTQIGVLLARGEHYDEALKAFDRVLSLEPNYPHALFEKGLVFFQGKVQPREGIKIWEQLIKTAPPENAYAVTAKRLLDQVRASMRPSGSPPSPLPPASN